MISIKALMAISMTGLGAAAMGADVYLASHKTEAVHAEPVATRPVALAAKVDPPAPVDRTVTLEAVTVYGSVWTPHKAASAPQRALVPCSDWRSLESGPAGHRVQQLCFADVPAAK